MGITHPESVWQTLAVLCPCQLFFSCNCPSTDSRKTKRKWEELGRKKQGPEPYCHSKPLSYLLWYDDVVTVAWWYYGPLLSEGELGNTKKEWAVTRPARNCSILSACNKNKKFFKIKFLYHNFHTLLKETHVNSHVISVWQSSKWKNSFSTAVVFNNKYVYNRHIFNTYGLTVCQLAALF